MSEQQPQSFSYGGQAVIEGVMMRGQYIAAIAVRNPEGEIVIKEELLNTTQRGKWAKLPFLRGLVLLWDSLGLGMRALFYSADVALPEEEKGDFSFESATGAGLAVVSVGLSIGLFIALPAAMSTAMREFTPLDSRFAADTVEGIFKLSLFVGYVWLIGHMKDVKRLFSYHGAEHKTINAYEAGVELTPEEVAKYSLQHPRCGTAFLLTLITLSVLVHILTGRPNNVFLLLLTRVGLVFPIAGTAYEIIRFSSKHLDNPIVRWIIRPNLAMQRLTTKEPDPKMLEVAITALQRVLAAERAGQPVVGNTASPEVTPAGD
jgi:uncharacterized protein YqhQ